MATQTSGWKKGQSGNPSGRPKGAGEVAQIRAEIQKHVPALIEMLVNRAATGDVAAARLLLERVVSPVKAVEAPVDLALPTDSLSNQGRALMDSVASGDLAPSQGAQLISALGTLAKVIETDELERRLSALEVVHARSQ